jgi:hypothetical protein
VHAFSRSGSLHSCCVRLAWVCAHGSAYACICAAIIFLLCWVKPILRRTALVSTISIINSRLPDRIVSGCHNHILSASHSLSSRLLHRLLPVCSLFAPCLLSLLCCRIFIVKGEMFEHDDMACAGCRVQGAACCELIPFPWGGLMELDGGMMPTPWQVEVVTPSACLYII